MIDAAAERAGVHADAGRLQRARPRLTARGRFDAGGQRVDPGAPARESSPFVEGDSPRICDDAYQLGDRGTCPTADAGAFRMGHALTVADRPTRTNNSGSAQPSPRKRVLVRLGLLSCCDVGPDVDPPAGQPRRETRVLTFAADREAQLVVRNHDTGRSGARVHDLDARHPRRRQRGGDELRRVLGPAHDVDLLVAQLVHHRPYPLTHRTDAGALRRHVGVGAAHRELRTVPGFARDRLDLDDALLDLRHLELEQLLDQPRVRTGHDDLEAAQLAPYRDHVHAQPSAVAVVLTRDLFGLRQDRLDLAQVDAHGGTVTVLLDDAEQDVTLDRGEVPVFLVVLRLAQPLHDDLARCGGGDPAEVGGRVVVLADLLPVLVQLRREDVDRARLAVDRDPPARDMLLGLLVGIEQGVLERLDDDRDGDVLVSLQLPQRGHVDVHVTPRLRCRRRAQPQRAC